MSSLAKTARYKGLLLKNYTVLYSAVRNHWYKDFKPTPVPSTEEQRKLSAEKYGLHPLEYDVYPDDGTGKGDYPKLPLISGDSRDPNYPWDFPELKRNYNEVLHAEADMIGEDRYDVNAKPRFSLWVMFGQFVGAMSLSLALYTIFDKAKCFPGLIPKQYPAEGKVHYLLEAKEEGEE